MQLQLTKTIEYKIHAVEETQGRYINIKQSDVVYCTKYKTSTNTTTLEQSQLYVKYSNYNDTYNAVQYLEVLDQSTVRFSNNVEVSSDQYKIYYVIEVYNVCNQLYTTDITDVTNNSKTSLPAFSISDNLLTTLNVNNKTIYSKTDPANYSGVNLAWSSDRINFRWIRPALNYSATNTSIIANNLALQKKLWTSNINTAFQPIIYDWTSSITAPTADVCLSETKYRDRYYTYKFKIWQYDSTATSDFEYFGSSGEVNLFISDNISTGDTIKIAASSGSLASFGTQPGYLLTTANKYLDETDNYRLGTDAQGLIYLTDIDNELGLISTVGFAPVYPNNSLISNFMLNTRSRYNGYTGPIIFSAFDEVETSRVFLVATYDNGTSQSIYLGDASNNYRDYNFNFSNLGFYFSFVAENSDFTSTPVVTITGSDNLPTENVQMLSISASEVEADDLYYVDTDVNGNKNYKYPYKIIPSYNAFAVDNALTFMNFNSELTNNTTGIVKLLGSYVNTSLITTTGLILSNVSITGFTISEQITIINTGNNTFNVVGSLTGTISSAQEGANTINIGNAVLHFNILPGSTQNTFSRLLIEDNVNIKISSLSIDVDTVINKNIFIAGLGTVTIYNNSLHTINQEISVSFQKDGVRYQLLDTITNSRLDSANIGEVLTTPGGSTLVVTQYPTTFYNVAFTNTELTSYNKQKQIASNIADNTDVVVTSLSAGILVESFSEPILYNINYPSDTGWVISSVPTDAQLSMDSLPPYNKWKNTDTLSGKIASINEALAALDNVSEKFTSWSPILPYLKTAKYISNRDSYDVFFIENFTLSNVYSYAVYDNTYITVYNNNIKVPFTLKNSTLYVDSSYLTNLVNNITVYISDVKVTNIGVREFQNTLKYNLITSYVDGVETNTYYYWTKARPIVIPSSYYYISNTIQQIISVNSNYDTQTLEINPSGSIIIYSYDGTIMREYNSYATKVVTQGVIPSSSKLLTTQLKTNITSNNTMFTEFKQWMVYDGVTDVVKMPLTFMNCIINTLLGYNDQGEKIPYQKYVDFDYKNNTTTEYGFVKGRILMNPYDLKNIIINNVVSAKLLALYNNLDTTSIQNVSNILNTTPVEFMTWYYTNSSVQNSVDLMFAILNYMNNKGYSISNYANKSSYINIQTTIDNNNVVIVNTQNV